jgi:hypothetical protein
VIITDAESLRVAMAKKGLKKGLKKGSNILEKFLSVCELTATLFSAFLLITVKDVPCPEASFLKNG